MSEPMKGSIQDCHLNYRLASKWIAPTDYITGATTSGTGGPATLTCGYGPTDTAPFFWQLGRNGVYGVRFNNTTSTVSYTWRTWDLDNRHPIYVRHLWTSTAAVASVASFNTVFSTVTTAGLIATPSTGLTRGMVGVAKGAAAFQPIFTRPAAIAPLSTGALAFQTLTPENQAIVFNFAVSSLTLAAVATDFVWLLGTEILYTPRLTGGDGSGVQGILTDPPLSTMPAGAATDFKIR